MANVNRKWYSGMLTHEDWWAVWMGLFFFSLGLLSLAGKDLVGWITYPTMWVFSPLEGGKGAIGSAFYALGGKYSLTAKGLYKGLGWWSILWIIAGIAVLIVGVCIIAQGKAMMGV